MPILLLAFACRDAPKPDASSADSDPTDSGAPTDSDPADSGPTDADGDGVTVAEGDCDDADPTAWERSFVPSSRGYWREALGERSGIPTAAALDGDDHPDLLLPVDDAVRVYTGDGEGGFSELVSLALPAEARAAAAAEADGRHGVAALDADGTVHWFAANEGGFDAATTTPTGCLDPRELVAGDLDGDGLDDLGVGCGDPAFVTLIADGAGGFSVASAVPGHPADRLRLGDLDGDGDLDAAMAGALGAAVTAWENDGGAGWTAHELPLLVGTWALAMADADADADLDLVMGHPDDEDLVWYENTGAWEFTRRAEASGLGLTTQFAELIAPADLDGDGVPELVATSSTLQTNTWSVGPDGPELLAQDWWDVEIRALVFADLDGDGREDAVVGDGAGTMNSRLSRGGGEFQGPVVLDREGVDVTAAGDLDGDGRDDLLVYDREDDVTWYYAGEDGFEPGETLTASWRSASGLVAADLDGDGDTDVAATSYAHQSVRVALLDAGTLGAREDVDVGIGSATHLEAADADGDGDLDLVVLALWSGDNGFLLLENDGAGVFTPGAPFVVGPTASPLTVGDFDGDGHLDVAVGTDGALETWRGDGAGGFSLESSVAMGATIGGLDAADVDGDGDDELVAAPWAAGQVLLVEDGAATPIVDVGAALEVDVLTFADVQGDATPELLAGNATSDLGIWAYDAGAWSEVLTIPNRLPGGHHTLVVLDADGDGDADLALGDEATGVEVHLSTCATD